MTYFDGLFFVSPAQVRLNIESGGSQDVYSLHFCRVGQIVWKRNDEEPRLLPAPVAWWTVPGERSTFGPSSGDKHSQGSNWQHFEVAFQGPRAALMEQSGLIPGDDFQPRFLLLHDAGAFERSFLALLALLEDQFLPRQSGAELEHAPPRAVMLLEEALLSLSEHSAPALLGSPLEQAVGDWLDAVKGAPEREWSIAEGAKELSISEGHFRRLSRKIVGVSPYRFALERRLDAAARRLRISKEPIKSLAPACGFKDVNHFSRLFAERYHLPPAAYRRANRVATLESARMRRRQNLLKSLAD
jgi:AraC-like DNA-binding protein